MGYPIIRSKRLNKSDLDSEKSSLKIRFVDVGLGDIQTEAEWEDTWKKIY